MHATHFETFRKTSSVSENYLQAESFTNTYFIARIWCFSQLLLTSNKLTMTSIGPSFFILGLVVASVTANKTSTFGLNIANSTESDNAMHDDAHTAVSFTVPPNINMNTKINSISNTISMKDTTTINSTIRPTTKGDVRTTIKNIPVVSVTPKPINPNAPTTKAEEKMTDKAITAKPRVASSDSTGIIIIVVIILVALGFGVACYYARKRGRRYSVDFASRPDETNIPLSAVEPELPADTVSQNGLQTFADTPTKEPEESEEKPDAQEEQKAEADKSKTEADPSADTPKEDVVEQSPPAPVEEKTDDEGAVSNKTSVESLKETNENNSNNADVSQQRDLVSSILLWDVPLDSPV